MFERLELIKLAVNILLISPVAALAFYRRFDSVFNFVGIWWLFGFFMTVLHKLAVTYYPVEYIAHPILLVALVAAVVTNTAVIILVLPEIIKKIR